MGNFKSPVEEHWDFHCCGVPIVRGLQGWWQQPGWWCNSHKLAWLACTSTPPVISRCRMEKHPRRTAVTQFFKKGSKVKTKCSPHKDTCPESLSLSSHSGFNWHALIVYARGFVRAPLYTWNISWAPPPPDSPFFLDRSFEGYLVRKLRSSIEEPSWTSPSVEER